MLAMMTATSIGLIPPMNSVRTALDDGPGDERRRARRVRFLAGDHGAEHDRGRAHLRRPRPERPWRGTHGG